MDEITAVNEAARSQGLSYGQYVIRNEKPVEAEEPEPEGQDEWHGVCPVCGVRFEYGTGPGPKQIYCSRACLDKAYRARKKSREDAGPEDEEEARACLECGTVFPVPKDGRTKNKRFCCASCRNKYNGREYWRKTHRKEDGMETVTVNEEKERERMERDRDVQFTHSEPETAEERLEKALQTELATTVGIKPKPDTLCPADAEHDPVNHPSYYTQGGVECKDAIRAAVTGLAGYEAFLTGNAIKYLWRWKRKNGAEDLRKAAFWIRELIEETEGRNEENT